MRTQKGGGAGVRAYDPREKVSIEIIAERGVVRKG